MAKRFLCVPASSTPSERAFSISGHVAEQRRASMKADNVNMLVTLNKNWSSSSLFTKTPSMATSSTAHVKEVSSADSFSETTESESEEELPSLPELSLPSDYGEEEMDL